MFESIEQLDELPRELGWPLEYRQIEPGLLSSTVAGLEGDFWFLMDEQSSRQIEVVAGSPHGMYMLALTEGHPAMANGKRMHNGSIFLQTPGSDIRATLPAGIRITQIGITEDTFAEAIDAVAPDLSIPIGEIAMLSAKPGALERVRSVMRSAVWSPPGKRAARDEIVSIVLTELITTAMDSGPEFVARDLHRENARRSLSKAREYIEAHLQEAIRVESLCRYSGTSLRSLQRVFSRDLGVTPQQYILARRLNAVRRHLVAANAEEGIAVTKVAQDYGFIHLGRFASHYRRYFGETPRATKNEAGRQAAMVGSLVD